MAKIFYVTENAPDYAQAHFFKTEKEALAYGISQLPGFEMYDEPMNDEENDGEEYFTGDSINVKEGFLYFVEDGEPNVEAMSEEEAKQLLADGEFYEETGGFYFPAKLPRGAYGYLGRDSEHKGALWSFYDNAIEESTNTGNLKYVKLFEQFINEEESAPVAEPKKHLYGAGSGFRKYSTDPSKLEGEAKSAFEEYSKYVGKGVTFNRLFNLQGEVPKELANGGDGYSVQPKREYEILDVQVFTDISGWHPFMEPNARKFKKNGFEDFVVSLALADYGVPGHVNVISAPPGWFKKNAKFK